MFELDSKKSVRVCIRCRPRSEKEIRLEGTRKCLQFTSDRLRVIVSEGKEFIFDSVFDEASSQQQIFDYCARNLVDGLFLGFNATIFAYGQTGSGKTHSMYGKIGSENEEGIIPRALRYMYQTIATEHQKKTVRLKVSFLEIYNDEIRDLLHMEIPSTDIAIREDGDGRIFFTGAKDEVVTDISSVFGLLEQGNIARSTAETLMNESSSRSHAIFSVNLDILELPREDDDDAGLRRASTRVLSKLQLVDLAGSERAKRTGAIGQRLKESVGINQGLLALGKVIRALTQPSRGGSSVHVPYRESKLTRFLQDSLGGNSHTVMLACVSPVDSSLAETLSTLQYASLARAVQNKLVANVETSVVDPGSGGLGSEGREIEAMRVQLARAKAEVLRLKRDEALQSLSASMQAGPHGWSEYADSSEKEIRLRLRKWRSVVVTVRQELEGAGEVAQLSRREQDSLAVACRKAVNDLSQIVDDTSHQTGDANTEASEAAARRELERTRKELEDCQEDLKRDEVIFSEKVQELRQLKKQFRRLQKDHEALLAQRSAGVDQLTVPSPVSSSSTPRQEDFTTDTADRLSKRLLQIDKCLEEQQAQLSRLWKEGDDRGRRGVADGKQQNGLLLADEIEKLRAERKNLVAKLQSDEARRDPDSRPLLRSESSRSRECFSRSTDGSVDADSLAGDAVVERLSRHPKLRVTREDLDRHVDEVVSAAVGRSQRQRLQELLRKSEKKLRRVSTELERARKEVKSATEDSKDEEDVGVRELLEEQEIVVAEVALYRRRLRENGHGDAEDPDTSGNLESLFRRDKDRLLQLLQGLESSGGVVLLLHAVSELLDLKLRVSQESSSSDLWQKRCQDLEVVQQRLQDASKRYRTDMSERIASVKAEQEVKIEFLLQQLRESEAQVKALDSGIGPEDQTSRARRPQSAGVIGALPRPPKACSYLSSGERQPTSESGSGGEEGLALALETENAKLKHWLKSERQRREQMEKRNGELTRELRAMRLELPGNESSV